jgi:hypothetical protein
MMFSVAGASHRQDALQGPAFAQGEPGSAWSNGVPVSFWGASGDGVKRVGCSRRVSSDAHHLKLVVFLSNSRVYLAFLLGPDASLQV